MPKGTHHIVCLTHEPAAVAHMLTEVLGLERLQDVSTTGAEAEDLLGWPPGNPGITGTTFGTGSVGLVEVIAIPEELRTEVQPGFVLASFFVRDLKATLVGVDETDSEVHDVFSMAGAGFVAKIANVDIGGVRFQMFQPE